MLNEGENAFHHTFAALHKAGWIADKTISCTTGAMHLAMVILSACCIFSGEQSSMRQPLCAMVSVAALLAGVADIGTGCGMNAA